MHPPVQLNLVVADLAATTAFYRRLGWPIREAPGGVHAACELGALTVEFDTEGFARAWGSPALGPGRASAVLGVAVPDRASVDRLHAELVAAGAPEVRGPHDAFWGARYSIVADPDGRPVGIQSPIDPALRGTPPRPLAEGERNG